MKLAFYVNRRNQDAVRARRSLVAAAKDAGFSVSGVSSCDVLVALGGDGTMLSAVREHGDRPVIGFNFGGLGFLSSVERHDFRRALTMLGEGRYRISERTMLAVGGELALNDIVIMREMTGHAALLDLRVNGCQTTRYMSDGLIIATPTGSTAYALSAGGPVLMPDVRNFAIVPMNPHSLGVRSVVVGDSVTLDVKSARSARGVDETVGVYADGRRIMGLGAGESVRIVKAAVMAKIIELEGFDPFAVMSRKLGWSGTNLK